MPEFEITECFRKIKELSIKKTQGTEQLRGEVPDMEKFEKFWGGIWEDETKTPKPKMDEYCCKEDKQTK